MSIAPSANSSSASAPFAAARTEWPSCSSRRRSSFRLTPSSSAMRIMGDTCRPSILTERRGPVNLRLVAWKGRQHGVRLAERGAEMTELQSPLDKAVLSELRESVGDDPEFVAELIDDFLADAPSQLDRCARPQPLAMRSLQGVRRTR